MRDGLTDLAGRYVRGELDEASSAAFEARLETDQAAREAVARATGAPRPGPGYRADVRRRLRPGPAAWLWARRPYRGHPAVWGALGAASVLLLLGLQRPGPAPREDVPVAARTTAEAEPPFPTTDVASLWAEWNDSPHLLKSHEQELRRLKGRPPERRTRSVPDPSRRH